MKGKVTVYTKQCLARHLYLLILTVSVTNTKMKALFFVILYAVTLSRCDFTVELQAENGISTEAEKMYRSNAKNGIAVLIKQGASITLFFQVTGNDVCRMQVGNLRYSNDGQPDEFTVTLNQGSSTTVFGTASTREATSNGKLWNDFQGTGPIRSSISMKEGLYNLVIKATKADEYGVELDYVSLQILDCNNRTTSVSAVSGGYIRYQECKPSKELKNDGLIITGAISCVLSLATIIVTIALKCWDKRCDRGEKGCLSHTSNNGSPAQTNNNLAQTNSGPAQTNSSPAQTNCNPAQTNISSYGATDQKV